MPACGNFVACPRTARESFEEWKRTFAGLYGKRFLEPGPKETQALQRLYEAPPEAGFHELLFWAHSRFAHAVRSALAARGMRMAAGLSFLDWYPGEMPPLAAGEDGSVDIFKSPYQSLVPREVRHALGEYYTPDWLAELILDEAGYDGAPGKRLLDPSCGTGTFLVLAIRRAKEHGRARGEPAAETARRILADVRGFEVNPLAAMAARANYLLALGEEGEEAPGEPPVQSLDAILEPVQEGVFDFVVGNPPWVRWDYLSPAYREATLPLWKGYGLFSLKGFQARLGGGKKDLSMLFTYVAADRYLKTGGTLGFLVTQELFKSKGAGEGFRRFKLGDAGEPLRVLKAHDFTALHPFDGAANKTAAIFLTKGEETKYPVPYSVWQRSREGVRSQVMLARPLGSVTGPWQTIPRAEGSRFSLGGPNPYKAMLGANANPYGVFWLEINGVFPGGLVGVRNLAEKGKKAIPAVTACIESELVYPAVRGCDVSRWGAEPGVYVLAVQDPDSRTGRPEAVMLERWPRTYNYLNLFREELLSRALYRKYHERSGHPFYSQFNISRKTFSGHRVVWKRMSNDLTAAVISEHAGPLGPKTVVPLETTAFIAASNEEEAHYLCAVLNSPAVREFVKSFSSAGRGFGTPWAIGQVRIPRFDSLNPLHCELAALSKELHQRRGQGKVEEIGELEAKLDALIRDLRSEDTSHFGLPLTMNLR
jgi:SAM-dependent methyltransferase